MNEHEAVMAGNRGGGGTPTSTSSYGGGAKDEAAGTTAGGARVGSEFEGTDDGYGGGAHYAQEGGGGDYGAPNRDDDEGFKMREGQDLTGPWADTKTKVRDGSSSTHGMGADIFRPGKSVNGCPWHVSCAGGKSDASLMDLVESLLTGV